MSEVLTTWLYPINWDGEYLDADGNDIKYGWKRMRVNFKYYDDSANGTDENYEVKLVRTDLRDPEGNVCRLIQIDKIEYNTYGMDVIIYYDMNPYQTVARIPQSQANKMVGPWRPDIVMEDTGYAGGASGNVVFSTANASQYDYYDITLDITIVGWKRRHLS